MGSGATRGFRLARRERDSVPGQKVGGAQDIVEKAALLAVSSTEQRKAALGGVVPQLALGRFQRRTQTPMVRIGVTNALRGGVAPALLETAIGVFPAIDLFQIRVLAVVALPFCAGVFFASRGVGIGVAVNGADALDGLFGHDVDELRFVVGSFAGPMSASRTDLLPARISLHVMVRLE